MSEENQVVGLAVPYFILIVLTLITAGSYTSGYPRTLWLSSIQGGIFIFYGCLFLIPVFILTIIFLATYDDSCEKVAFGLAIPGIFLILIGDIIALYYTVEFYLQPFFILSFTLPQLVIAFGLFAKRNISLNAPRTSVIRRPAPPPSRIPLRPSSIPRSRVQIPEQIRLAGTHGQAIKRCIRCGNTLDIRTRICYFCGARQPNVPPSRSRPNPPPTQVIRPPPPSQTPPLYQRTHPPNPPATSRHYCPNCGAPISPNHLFCTQCGSSLD
ncbi:MAG: zinc-ribbon domain-containing protein [Candidatus Helarchaeota archaeon]